MAALVITPEIEAAAQKLAAANGTTPTEAVAAALRSKLEFAVRSGQRVPRKSVEEIKAILDLHTLVPLNDLTEAEILGLDDFGIPRQTGLGR